MSCTTDSTVQPIYYRYKRYLVFGIISFIALIVPFFISFISKESYYDQF